MNQDISKSVTSLNYIQQAYNAMYDKVLNETKGVIPNIQIKPISFNIIFLSFEKGQMKTDLLLLNGSLNSKLQQLKFSGYIILNYSFKIQSTELVAKGLFRLKIIDDDFLKKA